MVYQESFKIDSDRDINGVNYTKCSSDTQDEDVCTSDSTAFQPKAILIRKQFFSNFYFSALRINFLFCFRNFKWDEKLQDSNNKMREKYRLSAREKEEKN
jgi:hypothetical protein